MHGRPRPEETGCPLFLVAGNGHREAGLCGNQGSPSPGPAPARVLTGRGRRSSRHYKSKHTNGALRRNKPGRRAVIRERHTADAPLNLSAVQAGARSVENAGALFVIAQRVALPFLLPGYVLTAPGSA